MPYHLRHVSQRRPQLDETSDELRALVAEHNTLDSELYRFARERFDSESPSPEELATDGEELRQLSLPVTAEGEAHKATKKERTAARRASREAREARRDAVRAERAAAKKPRQTTENEPRKRKARVKPRPQRPDPIS
jgi:hypothetical protein